MDRLRTRRARQLAAAAAGVLLAAGLLGCTTLAGNVSGSFSCDAPGGTCAPSTVIDDSALAAIEQTSALEQLQPAGPYRYDDGDLGPLVAASAGAEPGGGKVLKVVFPAYVDRFGRLHEQAVVRAVVDDPGQRLAALSGRETGPGAAAGLMGAAERAPEQFAFAAPAAPAAPAPGDIAGGAAAALAAPEPLAESSSADGQAPARVPQALAAIQSEVEARLGEERARRQAASFPGVVEH